MGTKAASKRVETVTVGTLTSPFEELIERHHMVRLNYTFQAAQHL